ncbi:hypothetical protein NDN08_006273 [Rhodosorus marinus]|uniref:RNA helicase n=1 Tax=Rhodosorus marinus TaxID=101924 RepID=A0AAV8UNC3_9RHOD|nr:hypothetical protein NDN08_006273 [Rhodosorus marinus]
MKKSAEPKLKRKRPDKDGEKRKTKKPKKVDNVQTGKEQNREPAENELVESKMTTGEEYSNPSANDEMRSVENFDLTSKTAMALKNKGFEKLFPIQAATLDIIRGGNDVIARAKTGSGKTLAFVIPVIDGLAKQMSEKRPRYKSIQVVALAPTRELANQVARDFEFLAEAHGLETLCVYGGTSFGPQCNALRAGVDVVIATPGRLIDHIERGTISLSDVKYFVLDEADEMLSMGFKEEVEKILEKAQSDRQTLLFSATVPKWVKELANKYLKPQHKTVDLVGDSANRTNKDITHLAISCPWHARGDTLGDLVKVHAGTFGKSLVFTDTKKEANELAEDPKLVALGSAVLHGDIPQGQRETTLEKYRDGRTKCLIATDVAARGLDIDGVDLVVQTHPPMNYDTYIHRSGRTGRAGKKGVCVTFYTIKEECAVRVLEHKTGVKLKRVGPPQPRDVVKAAATDATRFLENLHEDNIESFLDAARELMKSSGRDAEELLAAALAHMTGQTAKMKTRSILSCMENNVAIIVTQSDREFDGPRAGWQLVRRCFPSVQSSARGMTVCADKKSAIFDVPEDCVQMIKNAENLPKGVFFKVADELPELESRDMDLREAESQLREKKSFMFGKRTGNGNGKGGFGGRGGGNGYSSGGGRYGNSNGGGDSWRGRSNGARAAGGNGGHKRF